ncbi:MAG TPA: molybdenum cofactor guanylyltransferase [Candidatus Melainabacteria bacterium]|nr:molybdenum cofactor guanylyltransferase [Candidatus Melainabacteria bacterium]HIN64972.1 molybdenum cofactor guanylyltransferase [Candidatus Obscuribacterales bacterium]
MDFLIDSPTREPLPLPVTGLILSGGKSKRMGRPKAFLPYEGSTVIGHIVHEIKDLFNEIFIVANEVESFEDLGVDVVKDILPHRGPLGGILSGLMTSSNHYAFVMACDMPLIDKRLVRELVSRRQDNDVVVLSHPQGIEPLFGVYSKNCIKPLEESLFAGNLSVQDFLSGLKAGIYEWMPERQDAEALPPFFNINTPQDYSRVIARAGMGVSILPERRS